MLKDFGNFGAIKLNPPAPIHELVLIALDDDECGWTEADGEKVKRFCVFYMNCEKESLNLKHVFLLWTFFCQLTFSRLKFFASEKKPAPKIARKTD